MHTRRIKLYSDIVEASGYRIRQRPAKELVKFAARLRAIAVHSEFIESQARATVSDKWWRRDLGGLKLRGSDVDSIRVTQEGRIHESGGQYPYSNIEATYHFDYIIQSEASVRWEYGRLAERLNQDAQLRRELIEAKAPPVKIRANHIYAGHKKKFPFKKLLSCIDRIAKHIREEAIW